jgi:ABC-type bacteriocin/lantibiotic exporter with double-glycine peptidase domain
VNRRGEILTTILGAVEAVFSFILMCLLFMLHPLGWKVIGFLLLLFILEIGVGMLLSEIIERSCNDGSDIG